MPAHKGNQYAKGNKSGGDKSKKWDEAKKDQYIYLIKGFALLGFKDIEIADKLGINEKTFYEWKRKNKEIRTALYEGKEKADIEVIGATYKTAMGYDYEEEVITPQGEVKKVKRHQPANASLNRYWLNNRHRDRWSDKKEVDHTSGGEKINIVVTPPDMD